LRSHLRARPRHVVAGALSTLVTLPVCAIAIAQAADSPAAAPIAQTGVGGAAQPTLSLEDRRLRFGQPLVVRGSVGRAIGGSTVVLQHDASGDGRRWRSIDRAAASATGRYRLRAPLRGSGAVRVVVAAARAPVGGSAGRDGNGRQEGGAVGDGARPVGGAGASVLAAAEVRASRIRHVAVAARLVVKRRTRAVAAGSATRVAGVLKPRTRGSRVTVEGRVGRRWRPIAHARTRRNGHFSARVVARSLGTTKLRVRSTGTRANAAATVGAGALRGLRASTASWYGIYGGPLACGGSLGYSQLGVAHKTLPCGTKVTIRYRGRQVTVPVIDRGPYVGGREWDLTGATARALGFDGVGTIWTSV
jgi:peptidoglycan lytic transglycosylase